MILGTHAKRHCLDLFGFGEDSRAPLTSPKNKEQTTYTVLYNTRSYPFNPERTYFQK